MKKYILSTLAALALLFSTAQAHASTLVKLTGAQVAFTTVEPYTATIEFAPNDPALWREFGTYQLVINFGEEDDPVNNVWTTVDAGINHNWQNIEDFFEDKFDLAYPGTYEVDSYSLRSLEDYKFTKGLVTTYLARGTPTEVTRSLSTSTGAVGWQVSAFRPSRVCYTVSTSTTATIGGAASAAVYLETAPTNSATPGDWVEAARLQNSQSLTLALALQSVHSNSNELCADVAAGHWVKLREETSGTASVTYITGRETLR